MTEPTFEAQLLALTCNHFNITDPAEAAAALISIGTSMLGHFGAKGLEGKIETGGGICRFTLSIDCDPEEDGVDHNTLPRMN